MEWWADLSGLNQFFYGAAFVLSAFFIWQMVMAIIGLGGHEDVTSQVDTMDHSGVDDTAGADAAESVLAFKLLSVRSVIAFLTLFFWASALYLKQYEHSLGWLMLISCAWGGAAMALTAWVFHFMMKMTESGNLRMGTAVGAAGSVYMDIPANGLGEIVVMVSGVMTHVRARTWDGAAMKAGAKVKVTKVLDAGTLEVIADEAPG